MGKLVTLNVAVHFSWKGVQRKDHRIEKKPFKDLLIAKVMIGSECKKRWKSMRDHYKREKKEEKGTTGKAAKKKRAQYWQRLQFLDTVEDERTSFTNVVTASDVGASSETPQQGIPEEYEEDASMEHRSRNYLRIHHLSILNRQIRPHPNMKKGPNLNFTVEIRNKGKTVLFSKNICRKERKTGTI
ncbi:uncharacterized protein LOC120349428 [Nilaparvata lugens]|uniref:uncharacterized protein LOC120349428 n=1 Tax=Nilaparvata lugens TaxID=108931 RepID=UPI00193CAD73|nr:uncharacterized protein LOC120349428 [Nilaparvata lugens]